MDGFFDKYGRMIIIAVAICFVLLYLTPMRNVVGSSINGFAGNFANKVGESLGTVKMPDGSDNIEKEPSSMLINGESFRKKIPSEATSILFTNEKAPKGSSVVDLTQTHDSDVVGWLDGTTWKVSTQDIKKSVTFNTDSSLMFYDMETLKSIDFSMVDTSQVTNMYGMFDWSKNLEKLDLSTFDTSKVEDMQYMFAFCKNLRSLDLKNFDTSNVTNMSYMFQGCKMLTTLDVSHFDTSKVEAMSRVFEECESLTTLNLGNWKTSNLWCTYRMFYGCKNLQELDLSHFDTTKIENPTKNMNDMFGSCYSLKSIKVHSQTDIDKFKTGNLWINNDTKIEIK